MAAPRAPRRCRLCGGPAEGKGDLCAPCAPGKTAPAEAPARGHAGPFVCPFCRADLTWESLGTLEADFTIYVREKVFYCPQCRAFLGVSSWHTEG